MKRSATRRLCRFDHRRVTLRSTRPTQLRKADDHRDRAIQIAALDRPERLRRAFPQHRAGFPQDGWAGGVYLWQSRADAEAFYSGPWLRGIRERYGMDPQIKYFETACITDNSAEAVLLPEAAE